jgi:enoyl-CoA hydratase/carnithine racemase
MPGADDGRRRLVVRDAEGQARLNLDVVRALVAQLAAAGPRDVVTLEGSAGAFCLGLHLDLAAPLIEKDPEATVTAALDHYGALLEAVGRCPRPVIALVDGAAMGGGLGLAASADLVLATPRATFGLPEALIGLLPACALGPAARRIGVPRARLLALGGPTLGAADALRIGLVDEVVEDLEAAAHRYGQRFRRMDDRSVAAIKRLVADHFPCGADYAAGARDEVLRLGGSPETNERLRRFVDGEPPWALSAR